MASVKVVTWNVQGGYSNAGKYVVGEQGSYLKSLAPDVVMLQEVSDASSKDSHGVEQTEALAQAAGLSHHRFWRLDGWRGYRAGVALLARWPLADVQELAVPRPWYTRLPWSYEGPRGILSASLVVHGNTWRVRTTHMSHHGGEYHVNHTRLLAQQAGQTAADVWPVLGGDFNLGQDDPLFNDLRTTMEVVAGVGGEIDLIWVGQPAACTVSGAGRVDCGGLSDHDPVVVTLERPVASQPQPDQQLFVRFSPSPLVFPRPTSSPLPVKGRLQVTVHAVDAVTAAVKSGFVRVDAADVGGGTISTPTGQVLEIPYIRTVTIDPVTHQRESVVSIARATVSVPGYAEMEVDWGV